MNFIVKKIIGIFLIVLALFLMASVFQSISCGILGKCLGMDKFLLFLYMGDNMYKMFIEAILILSLWVFGGGLLL